MRESVLGLEVGFVKGEGIEASGSNKKGLFFRNTGEEKWACDGVFAFVSASTLLTLFAFFFFTPGSH